MTHILLHVKNILPTSTINLSHVGKHSIHSGRLGDILSTQTWHDIVIKIDFLQPKKMIQKHSFPVTLQLQHTPDLAACGEGIGYLSQEPWRWNSLEPILPRTKNMIFLHGCFQK